MPIINNMNDFEQIKETLPVLQDTDSEIVEPFTKDFTLRFCWSSNAIEGNTLTLDETISVIEYDEVRSGHTFSEYQEAKNLYRAVNNMMIPLKPRIITDDWLKKCNSLIQGTESGYRQNNVYIGSLAEAVYYPPTYQDVPKMMERFLASANIMESVPENIFPEIARQHITFEQIHPFKDGNGRTGRILLNQQLINCGLLPLYIKPGGKYRQAFRQYEKNGDLSLMVHILCQSELQSIETIRFLSEERERQQKQPPFMAVLGKK